MENVRHNNEVVVSGEIVSGYKFSHEVFGEKFYTFDLKIKRLSDAEDVVPVTISERLTDIAADNIGCFVRIEGQFRSFNKHEGEKSRLVLTVFATSIEPKDEYTLDTNYIFLDGYICKPISYRETPLGREIADILLAVNRPYGKSDYIPCILWGRNARFASELGVGQRLKVGGRIQSRSYQKRYEDGTVEERVAYEVSTNRVQAVEEK